MRPPRRLAQTPGGRPSRQASGMAHLRKLTLLLALVCLLVPAATASASKRAQPRACPATGSTPARASNEQLTQTTLCLLNAERGRYGIRPLSLSSQLSGAADGHAADMVRRGYFAHTSLSGTDFVDRIKRSGYLSRARSWYVGENLAWGAGRNRSTPRGIVASWMASPPHRANILNGRFRDIGIGVALGAPRRTQASPAATYATSFGARS